MKRATLLVAAFALYAGCDDHTEGAAEAVVGEAQDETDEAPPAERQTLTIDPERSSVGFTGAKLSDSHTGTFERFSGTIDFDPANVTASSVNVTVQTASVSVEPERLQNHLKQPEFFDVDNHPEATFRSTSIEEQSGEGGATHRVTGNLTLRGQTRSISFPAKVQVKDEEIAATAEFVIQRQDFGIVYPGMPDDLINDEVVIRFDVHAPRS